MFKLIDKIDDNFVILDDTTMLDELVSKNDLLRALNLGIKIDGVSISNNKLLVHSLKLDVIKSLYVNDSYYYDNYVFTNDKGGITLGVEYEKEVDSVYIPSFVYSVMFDAAFTCKNLKVTGGRSLKTCEFMFFKTKIKHLDLSDLYTCNVSNMHAMFYGCSRLESIHFGKIDTSKVMDISSMFRGCSSLKDIDLDNFDTSSVKYADDVFVQCTSLSKSEIINFKENIECFR